MKVQTGTLKMICAIGIVIVTGCQTERYHSFENQAKFSGRPDITTTTKEFLIAQRAQLGSLNNPKRLQRWAVKLIVRTGTNDMPFKIEECDVILRQASGPKTENVGTVHLEEANNRACVTILMGGSGAFGWYGVKIGDPSYRPSFDRGCYLEWISGCYLFYFPP